ncbi:MAG: hypothetical protein IPP77_05655 [Bacteroidetes bacterium]|nr:hypothetical protein [Bacteroidota bacterium]
MIRKTFGVLLAFIIVAQGLMNLGLYAYYNLNKRMIAEKLCINKNNPQLHCNGHCYLTKQLKKAEENEKQQSQSLKEKEEQVVTTHEVLRISYFPQFVETGLYIPYPNSGTTPPFTEIIPPPKLVA